MLWGRPVTQLPWTQGSLSWTDLEGGLAGRRVTTCAPWPSVCTDALSLITGGSAPLPAETEYSSLQTEYSSVDRTALQLKSWTLEPGSLAPNVSSAAAVDS